MSRDHFINPLSRLTSLLQFAGQCALGGLPGQCRALDSARVRAHALQRRQWAVITGLIRTFQSCFKRSGHRVHGCHGLPGEVLAQQGRGGHANGTGLAVEGDVLDHAVRELQEYFDAVTALRIVSLAAVGGFDAASVAGGIGGVPANGVAVEGMQVIHKRMSIHTRR